VTGARSRRGPLPLPEPERRAWLAALGLTLWEPRAGALAAPGSRPEAGVGARERSAAAAAGAGEATAATGPTATGTSAAAVDEAAVAVDGAGAGGGDDAAAMDWETLRDTVRACRLCGLCATRTQAVFGVGDRAADLLVIGEAPGQEEDRRGEPFVGRAGQLLDRMLAAIALDRKSVYITNILKCRPPDNRDPHADEAAACAPYLRRQIELLEPRVILAVGRVSAQQLLATADPVGRLRGGWHRYGPLATPVRVTYHPAYLLRQPAAKRKAWEDLKRVRDALAEDVPG